MAGEVAHDFGRALVPDDDRTAASRPAWPDPVSLTVVIAAVRAAAVDALEISSRQLVIFDRHCQPANGRIQGRPFRHRPGPKDAAEFDPQVVVQPGRIVQLDYEP